MTTTTAPTPDYTENVTIPATKNNITITGYPGYNDDTPARVMATNPNQSVFTIQANDVKIYYLEIYGATGANAAGIDVTSGVTTAILSYNRCGFSPYYKNTYGIILADVNTLCTISSNRCGYNDIGIFVTNGSYNNTIQKNTCTYNDTAGIASTNNSKQNSYLENIASHNLQTGIDITLGTENIVWGNTVEDNEDIGISVFNSSDKNTLSGNKVRYNDPDGNGVGMDIQDSNTNMVSGNQISGNKTGIYLFGNTGQYNTFTGNTVSSNQDAGIFAGSASPTANNWFYYNFLFSNGDDLDFQANAAGNDFTTPTPWGYWFDTGQTRKSALGNYHSSYGGTDANGDGIGDGNHSEANVVDSMPLMYKGDRYDLQTWFASGDRMYKGGPVRAGGDRYPQRYGSRIFYGGCQGCIRMCISMEPMPPIVGPAVFGSPGIWRGMATSEHPIRSVLPLDMPRIRPTQGLILLPVPMALYMATASSLNSPLNCTKMTLRFRLANTCACGSS